MIKHTLEYRTINGETGTTEEQAVTRWGAMSAALEQLKVIAEEIDGLCILGQQGGIKMSLLDKLKNKGFELITYEDDKFYSKTLTSIEEVEKFHKLLGEDSGQFEYDLNDVKFTLEINPEFTFAQYLFSDADTGGNWFTHDQLTREEFEELLDHI